MRWLLALLLLIGCTSKNQSPAIVIWENEKAVAVSLESTDSLKIFVEGSSFPVLGEVTSDDGRLIFTPAVPFERGQSYRVSSGITFIVPVDSNRHTPILTGSFPSCDTVPSNLLKIYLQFSEPMSESRSSEFVQLFDAVTGDTIRNAFLDLRPELWNENGTVLTLWLDPGRIKQDLIPNKTLGVVMNDHRKYRLTVAKGWRSKNGLSLEKEYNKEFITAKRDVVKPGTSSWKITTKRDTVLIDFHESLDWSLLNSSISIEGIASKTITGPCERRLLIIPEKPLPEGNYSLNIQSRLEDLAGNNLNRLFETDVTNTSNQSNERFLYTLPFQVK